MFTKKLERTPPVDAMHEIWTGSLLNDRAQIVQNMKLNGFGADHNIRMLSGSTNSAEVVVDDELPSELTFLWSVRFESKANQSGGDLEEVPAELPNLVEGDAQGRAKVLAPREPGAYRLFVEVRDSAGSVGHANLPFFVEEN